MPHHYFFFTPILLFILAFPLAAQEICNNQIDDDNDGLIDFSDCDCYSQRGNVWHFGPGFSVDFNSPSPQVLQGSPMESFEGCSSICNEEGNLLFFTNGGGRPNTGLPLPPGTIWDQNGDVMYDMMGEQGGGYSSQQSSVIIPKPGSSTNYYLFTMDELESSENRGFSYFEIDMTGNDGLGEVVLADEQLFAPTYEAIAAIQHENEEDYWIIIVNPQNPQREFLVYEATALGVSLSGNYTFNLGPFELFPSKIKASPTGDRINQRQSGEITFFDFDKATGVISNPIRIVTNTFGFGDFSPSGRYYYCEDGDFPATTQRRISRIDLSNLSPDSPFEVIDIVTVGANNYLQWQLGPLGQIYFFEVTGSTLGAIQCPDSNTPTVEPNYLSLISTPGASFTNNSFGLPNFPNHFFYRPFIPLELSGETSYELCGTDSVTLSVQTNKCADFLWNTGETTSSITVDAIGIYTVTATDECETQTLEIEVTNAGSFSITTLGPPADCIGNTVVATVDAPVGATLNWFDQSGNLLSTDTAFSFLLTQDTTLLVTAELECGSTESTITINAIAPPDPVLDFSNAGCSSSEGFAEVINPTPSWIVSWLDSTGNSLGQGATIDGLSPGSYSAVVSNFEDGVECNTTLPFTIAAVPSFESVEFSAIDNPCPGDSLGRIEVTPLDGTPPYSYEWTSLATNNNIGTDSVVAGLPDGTYGLVVTDAFGCTVEQSINIQSPIPPAIDIQTDPAFCENDNGSIFIALDDNLPFNLFLDGISTTEEALLGLFPGTYPIELLSQEGCLWLDTMVVIENEELVLNVSDTIFMAIRERPLELVLDLPSNNWTFNWSPAIGLSCIDCPRPFTILSEDQTYLVQVTDPDTDCTALVTVTVITRPPEEVFIPNAFSPNDDGINDRLEVFSSDSGVVLTNMQIFDRWGELIFESAQPDATWNGTFRDELMPPGIYVYVVEIQKSTGSELLSGDVLLMR